jgi:hypothetical protein
MDLSEFQTPKMLHFLKPSVPQSFEPWPWPAMDHLMRPGDGTDWEAIGRIEGGAWGLANRANRGRAEDLRWFELTSKWSTPKVDESHTGHCFLWAPWDTKFLDDGRPISQFPMNSQHPKISEEVERLQYFQHVSFRK